MKDQQLRWPSTVAPLPACEGPLPELLPVQSFRILGRGNVVLKDLLEAKDKGNLGIQVLTFRDMPREMMPRKHCLLAGKARD